MKTGFLPFFRNNWIGATLGIGYCACAFLMFFFSLSYGAACPESGPNVCNSALEPFIPIFRAISTVPILIWGMIFYSGQQIMLLSGMTTQSDYPSSFFAINVLPGISIALALFVLATIGGFAQKLSRIIKR